MKDKILMFIIGALVGAIITTLCFVFLVQPNNRMDMPNRGERPEMMQGEEGEMPPEKPSGEMPTNSIDSEITNTVE